MAKRVIIDIEQVRILYQSGKKLAEIAKELDVANGTLYKNIRYEIWYNQNNQKTTEEMSNKISELYNNGISLKEIIKQTCCTRNVVIRILDGAYKYKETVTDEELINKKFERLIVKSVYRKQVGDRKNRICVCDCICGTIDFETRCSNLLRGCTKSCGCIRNGSIGDLDNAYWNKITLSAYKRKIEVTVTQEYCWELFLKQNRRCKYSGVELFFSTDWKNRYTDRTASLDRIDSSKDYVEGNLQWIHKDINWMKTDFPEHIFLQHCLNIANHQNSLMDNQ